MKRLLTLCAASEVCLPRSKGLTLERHMYCPLYSAGERSWRKDIFRVQEYCDGVTGVTLVCTRVPVDDFVDCELKQVFMLKLSKFSCSMIACWLSFGTREYP